MPVHAVFVCDRCSTRYEGNHLDHEWCEINVMQALEEDEDPMGGADAYVLCPACAKTTLRHLREWISPTPPRTN